MTLKLGTMLLIVLLPLGASSLAQAPPASPAPAGPSLEVTLKFIVEKLSKAESITWPLGKGKYNTYLVKANPQVVIVADEKACELHTNSPNIDTISLAGINAMFTDPKNNAIILMKSATEDHTISFADLDTARRVGNAILHAGFLCRSRSAPAEPF